MSFDPFWFCSWKVLLAFWICCFQKHQGRFLLLLGIWRIKDKTLNSHFDFHFSKKNTGLSFFSAIPPPVQAFPLVCGIGLVLPIHMAASLIALVQGIRYCAFWCQVQSQVPIYEPVYKKKKKPGVWRKDAPLWIKSLHQLLSPQKRPGPLNALFKF